MNKEVMFSSKTDLWETPQDLFDKLDAEFHFELDVCALPDNAKCKRYYTPEQDGLSQKWGGVLLVQSAIRTADRKVGQEGGGIRDNGCNAFASQNGYEVVSRLHTRQGRDSVFEGEVEVWRVQ